uniref:Uncharacterized protein n=1 Tax=Ditylenchus dipsaci TaxID=166011 RepID=A0A915CT77_9BILA
MTHVGNPCTRLYEDEEVENEADELEAQHPSTSAENFDMVNKDKPFLKDTNCEPDAAVQYNFFGPEDPASKVQRKPPKRRTKEEIDQEKLLKEYLFCYINDNVLALDEALKDELTARFTERSISEQLVFLDTNEMRAIWKRKRVDAFLEDGKLHSSRTMDLENVLATFIDGDSLAQLIKSNSLLDYLQRQLSTMDVENAQMTVVVYGKCPTRENLLNHALFEAFERFRVQFRFMSNALNCSFLIVQIHRALAKMEKKLDHDMSSIPVIAIEKGFERVLTCCWTGGQECWKECIV